MATLARNRFPSGLGWFVLLALLLLSWCHGITSCGTRQKTVARYSLDSLWNRQVLELAREQARIWYYLDEMKLEQLRTWSGEIVDFDTAGRTRRRTTFSGSDEGKAKGSSVAGSAGSVSEKVATGTDKGRMVRNTQDVRKEGDTSLIKNVPWHAWILGIFGTLFLVYLILKKYGLL